MKCFALSLLLVALVHIETLAAPNVILCMADDLGWGDTGFNGSKVALTPHLDAMVGSGVRFDRWYAGAPVCSPTRANCITGRHPLRVGINTANNGRMLPAEETLAELLRDNGYATGHFGKWHLGTLTTTIKDSNRGRPGNVKDFAPPWQHGFDICFSTEAKVPTYDPMRRPSGEKVSRYGWTPVPAGEGADYGTHYFDQTGRVVTENLEGDDSRVIMDRAIPFVRDAVAADRPFFCIVWFHAPHLPVVAGPKHSAAFADRSWEEQMYYGCIAALDEQIGRLRSELATLGVADNTMLWFSSDNGPENRTPGSAGKLRARKRSLYEGGIRVPGILVWPDRIKQANTISAPCHTGDYFPTILDVVGIPAGQRQLDGISLMPLIDGERTERNSEIFFQFGKQAAVIGDEFKLYRAEPEQDWELYEIQQDVGEANDVASQHGDVLSQMRERYASWASGL